MTLGEIQTNRLGAADRLIPCLPEHSRADTCQARISGGGGQRPTVTTSSHASNNHLKH